MQAIARIKSFFSDSYVKKALSFSAKVLIGALVFHFYALPQLRELLSTRMNINMDVKVSELVDVRGRFFNSNVYTVEDVDY